MSENPLTLIKHHPCTRYYRDIYK